MAKAEWVTMGCNETYDEWSCVAKLGQTAADAAFATHWDSWTTKEDIELMVSYGLNTIRVPIGFWMNEGLVYGSDNYPRGGLKYLDRLMGWAADAGLYVILDHHGAPGSQSTEEEFTGHVSVSP